MPDRFTRTLLVLIVVALWGLLLRSSAPAPAHTGQDVAQPASPVISHLPARDGVGRFLILRNDKLSLWKVHLSDEGKDKMHLQDVKSLP